MRIPFGSCFYFTIKREEIQNSGDAIEINLYQF